MKKTILALAITLVMVSCGLQQTKKETATQETKTEQAAAATYTLDALLESAATLVDKKVVVVGSITHTCKHSGRRCFIVGEDPNTTFRVEAKGEIGGFNRELIGSELAITGILRERRLTKEYIKQYEEQVREKEDGSAESCGAEINNILAMRDWMKKNNKDYFSTYYMDGESFNVVENE